MVLIGLSWGLVAASLFLIANLYVTINLLAKIFFGKRKFKWLRKMESAWHYIHYVGNMSAFTAVSLHLLFFESLANYVNWTLVAFEAWLVFCGITIRFTKAPVKLKNVFRKLSMTWYMFSAFIILLVVSHLPFLPLMIFPFPK
ncbi:MAG: hypothetical protein M1542_03940 [Thermotogae bacterium]|jgi:hypothetical protein|nr:hypothetical protein [Thermotogota bacterium]MCL5032391.1 hypothetical protein [Thermotogota bacterium]